LRGTYRIKAELLGFKSVVRENLALLLNTPLTLDLKFAELGSTIEVNVFSSPFVVDQQR